MCITSDSDKNQSSTQSKQREKIENQSTREESLSMVAQFIVLTVAPHWSVYWFDHWVDRAIQWCSESVVERQFVEFSMLRWRSHSLARRVRGEDGYYWLFRSIWTSPLSPIVANLWEWCLSIFHSDRALATIASCSTCREGTLLRERLWPRQSIRSLHHRRRLEQPIANEHRCLPDVRERCIPLDSVWICVSSDR